MDDSLTLTSFGVKDKTVCFCTDNEPSMKSCFKGHERNGCFSHIEAKASQHSLDSSTRLKDLRRKLRKVAKKSNKSPKFKSCIEKNQVERELKPKTLKQEIATRFTCTYDMIKSFLNSPNENYDNREEIEAYEFLFT